MKERPLLLTPPEAKLGHKLTEVVRVMKVQPDLSKLKPGYADKPKEWRRMIQLGPVHHGYDADAWVLHDVGDKASAVGYCDRTPPLAVGDVCWGRETLQISNYPHESFSYVASGEVRYPESVEEREWFWLQTHGNKVSSTTMPKWAARFWWTVTAVSVRLVDEKWCWVYTIKEIERGR